MNRFPVFLEYNIINLPIPQSGHGPTILSFNRALFIAWLNCSPTISSFSLSFSITGLSMSTASVNTFFLSSSPSWIFSILSSSLLVIFTETTLGQYLLSTSNTSNPISVTIILLSRMYFLL